MPPIDVQKKVKPPVYKYYKPKKVENAKEQQSSIEEIVANFSNDSKKIIDIRRNRKLEALIRTIITPKKLMEARIKSTSPYSNIESKANVSVKEIQKPVIKSSMLVNIK